MWTFLYYISLLVLLGTLLYFISIQFTLRTLKKVVLQKNIFMNPKIGDNLPMKIINS